jgi:hypothetical protein
VGDKRKESMLKELDAQLPKLMGFKEPELTSTRAPERTKAAQTTNQLPQGTTSPVGTKQNKITNMRKGKKIMSNNIYDILKKFNSLDSVKNMLSEGKKSLQRLR